MKIFVAVLLLAACVCAEEKWTIKSSEQIKKIRSDCLNEHPLSEEQVAKMKNFEYPNEEPVRKYLLCTAEKMGIFCPNEGYHADRIVQQFKMDMEESEIKKVVEDCIAKFPKADKSNDVAVYEGHTCFMSSTIGDRVKSYVKQHQEAAQKAE